MVRWSGALAVSLVALVVAGCGGDENAGDGGVAGEQTASNDDVVGDPVGTTAESSPFTVGHEPEGYRLVQVGRGTYPQNWSSDSFGDDEPITVLAPPDADPAGPEAVRVSLTGYLGFEGGLDQASSGYNGGDAEHFSVDGLRAIYTPDQPDEDGDGDDEPADLVLALDEDLALRVAAPGADRDELVGVARTVVPRPDHLLAPTVPDPPGDLAVAGAADADVGITLSATPLPSSDALPAGERAHTAVWAAGEPGTAWTPDAGTIAVSTLPGRALDLDAVAEVLRDRAYGEESRVDEVDVDGRPGVSATSGPEMRSVLTSTPDGDLLVVVARGAARPEVDDLVAVAASVGPATAAEWDELAARAAGGPGLHPDDGAIELVRGTAGDVGWLAQARRDDGTLGYMSETFEGTAGDQLIDPCLKLDVGGRACSGAGGTQSSSRDVVTVYAPSATVGEHGEFPAFMVVMTPLAAESVRVATTAGPVETPLVEVPGGLLRGTVVVAEPGVELQPGTTCGGVELLDPARESLPCS